MPRETTDLPPQVDRTSHQNNLEAVLDATHAMVRGLDGVIRYWSAGAAQLFGWSSAEAVGRLSHDLLATVFPAPREEIQAALIAKGHWQGDLTCRNRDGRTMQVATRWVLQRDAVGEPSGVVEISTDVTAQREADAAMRRLAAIVESSSDAIVGKDLNGIVTSWNSAAEAMFGYWAEEIIGRPIVVLFPPDRIDEENAIIGRVRRGERVDHYETVRQRKDGSRLPVSVSVAPIRDHNGTIIGASKIVRDLTEREERDLHLRDVQSQLFHAQRLTELGQLVSTLVHEVNQPLTAIANYSGASRRLLSAGNQSAAAMAVQKITEQTERAHQIIQRLRGFVRGGTAERRPEALPLVIEEAVGLALPSLKTAEVVLGMRLDPAATYVAADRVQIQQVLFNLVRNAAEAMQHSPRREVLIATAPDAAGLIEVSVADTGPGLDPEVRANLFQPFITTKGNGMGIGLSVCRSIVLAHGGRLWAEDNPDGGTVFRFTLPRAEEAETAAEGPG